MQGLQPYRVTLLLNPRASGAERKAVESFLSSWAGEHGGRVRDVTTEDKRKLAYPVRLQSQVVLLRASLDVPPDQVRDLSTRLTREASVLRFRLFRGAAAAGKRLRDVPLRKAEEAAGVKTAPRKEKAPLEKLEEKIDEILKEEVL